MAKTEQLIAALDRATTWSSYLDSQLSAAVTLTNAALDPERTRKCMLEVAAALVQLTGAVQEYAAVWDAPEPSPSSGDGDEVTLDDLVGRTEA